MSELSVVEICAGAGGQSLGLEMAGFAHEAAVEIDPDAAETLRLNRPDWKVIEGDVRDVNGRDYKGIDLLAGGVPCPPFSIAGRQLGSDDDRDLFPEALRLVRQAQPRAVLLENVRGLAGRRFDSYRHSVIGQLADMGYAAQWRVLNASDYGVPQLRPRFLLVALLPGEMRAFNWPGQVSEQPTVGGTLHELMRADGWKGAASWARRANAVAPTLVGGSRKHGGADLGPTRAKAQWLKLGVDGRGIANTPPTRLDPVTHLPRLTLQMVSRLQGFPDDWRFFGRKTSAYRQIGNAFPPPVARAVGTSITRCLRP